MASGGKRDGAGRPAGAKNKIPAQGRKTPYKTISLAGTPEEIDRLKVMAEQSGKSVSRFILDVILNS